MEDKSNKQDQSEELKAVPEVEGESAPGRVEVASVIHLIEYTLPKEEPTADSEKG